MGRSATPALLSWSSGKDSAYSLAEVRRTGEWEVVGLVTTLTRSIGRVSVHGVREELLDRQARSLGLPLLKIELPHPCPNDEYERALRSALRPAFERGVRHVIFGDLFLEDIRRYRESRLASAGFDCVFPLWGRETAALAREMIDRGVEARLCCVDPRRLDRSFAGRPFDRALLAALPSSVDPCGERGEFHTFVSRAPGFSEPVPVRTGSTVERDGFLCTDLEPVGVTN